MQRRLGSLLALVLATVTACSSAGGPGGGVGLAVADVPRAAAPAGDATAAAQALNDFGLDLYRAAPDASGNLVVSPASIALALAMARAGARGETAAQMDAVLRAAAADEHASWLNALEAALTSRSGTFKDAGGQDSKVTLRIANAPFVQRDLALEPAYLEALASRFGAGVRLVDYVAATEVARQAINGWVSDQTERRIPELLTPGDLDALTRLVLVNAIYLKAAWQTPFPEAATAPGPFTRLDGSTISVTRMNLTETLPYAAGEGWRAVEVPYVGGSLAMTIIVPDDLRTFEAKLDAAAFGQITSALSPHSVALGLPKFRIETRTDLAGVLAGLGMPLAFDPDRADFSGITAAEQLYISAVVHQADIAVDEKGTEAAAATAVVIGTTAAPSDQVTLRIDRPFLFALRDVPTGALVFLGRVTEPVVDG